MSNVRTRFAPSPTGYMHVGNLRTALYTYLHGQARTTAPLSCASRIPTRAAYVEGAVDIIYNTLRETGLIWDEGPDIGGPVGPYVQSQRMGMFKTVCRAAGQSRARPTTASATEDRLDADARRPRSAAGEP